ncbi:unnamed protein product [Rotaria socialis]|uniref:Uncharacterized protein n=1 Tax=Rotaria socialis TaxID=392032 RepID=A0A821W279_9BILA|nr:unnamed protein product [Rotaria socialis]CAF3771256.1 unnamed protein product [Rotaria socialis]CAF4691439.1 unnamed protein product [Rotaria socialis]CAF4887960.1 unnamed protein product [Rotaria socialis]CAF4916741.1 unnamed protein product [Rotaria socialis]
MSQPEPIIINTSQLDNPIYIVLPMPTIMLQIPPIRIILSHEFGNEHHSESNSKCTRFGHLQSEEDEVDEDYMKIEEIKQEEIEVEEIEQEEIEIEEIEIEEIEVEEIKQEEMIFQYPFNQQHDSNKYILLNDVNLNESSLSYLSEASIKDKIYGWEQFLIE